MSEDRFHRKKLVVLFGLIASGKSHLGRNWADTHGFCYHNTDIIRKERAGQEGGASRGARFGTRIYSAPMSRLTYQTLIARARDDLLQRPVRVVVLDGSFSDPLWRQQVVAELGELAEIYYIYCFCSDHCRRARLQERAADSSAVSDGRWEIYQEQKKRFGPPVPIGGTGLLELDTDRPVAELQASLDVFIGLAQGK